VKNRPPRGRAWHLTTAVGKRSLLAKTCVQCHVLKDAGWFRLTAKGCWTNTCRSCLTFNARSRPNTPWRQHGLTDEKFKRMLAKKDGCCWNCGEPKPEDRALDIDHNHKCCPGSFSCGDCVRGILCRACNNMAGWIEKIMNGDPRALLLFDYLEEAGCDTSAYTIILRCHTVMGSGQSSTM
jgi:hypothetical protein